MKKLITILLCFVSVNAYSQWISQSITESAPMFSCSFPSANTGYICGYGQLIRKTTNGGVNWLDISIGITGDNYNSIWFINDNTGFIASTGNYLMKTTNGGLNWNETYFNLQSQGQRVFFINNQTGWAASNKLFKTTNAGENWFMISNSAASDMFFINETLGWKSYYIGSGSSQVLRTSDAGSNWEVKLTTSNFRNVYSIKFINENTGWVCGYRGYIAKTTDSGNNWTVQRDGDFEALYDIQFVNPSIGFAAGDAGSVVYTTNGGDTWTEVIMPSSRYEEIEFINANTGWIIGSYGVIYKTTNAAGLTFVNPTNEVADGFELRQNYPNPFNPSTTIEFSVPNYDFYTLKIYDVNGKEVASLVNERLNAGSYNVVWNGLNNSSGIYFYKLVSGSFSAVKKMILVK